LKSVYEALLKDGKPFEVVFVSDDKDATQFGKYFGEMPWKAVPYESEERRGSISSKFSVMALPTLVVLNSQGKVISKNAQPEVAKNKEKCFHTWADAAATPEKKGGLFGFLKK